MACPFCALGCKDGPPTQSEVNRLWRLHQLSVHPDLAGGNNEASVYLNQTKEFAMMCFSSGTRFHCRRGAYQRHFHHIKLANRRHRLLKAACSLNNEASVYLNQTKEFAMLCFARGAVARCPKHTLVTAKATSSWEGAVAPQPQSAPPVVEQHSPGAPLREGLPECPPSWQLP